MASLPKYEKTKKRYSEDYNSRNAAIKEYCIDTDSYLIDKIIIKQCAFPESTVKDFSHKDQEVIFEVIDHYKSIDNHTLCTELMVGFHFNSCIDSDEINRYLNLYKLQ